MFYIADEIAVATIHIDQHTIHFDEVYPCKCFWQVEWIEIRKSDSTAFMVSFLWQNIYAS